MYKVFAIVRIVYQDRAKSLRHFVEVKEWHLESKCLISPFFSIFTSSFATKHKHSLQHTYIVITFHIRIESSKYYKSILVIVVFYLIHSSSVSDRNKGNICCCYCCIFTNLQNKKAVVFMSVFSKCGIILTYYLTKIAKKRLL